MRDDPDSQDYYDHLNEQRSEQICKCGHQKCDHAQLDRCLILECDCLEFFRKAIVKEETK